MANRFQKTAKHSVRKRRPPRLGLLIVYPTTLVALLYVSIFLFGNSQAAAKLAELGPNSAIPGRFVFQEIRMHASLTDFDVFGVHLYTPDGREVISVDKVHAQADVQALLAGEIGVSSVTLYNPRILISFDDKGNFELLEALSDETAEDPLVDALDPPSTPPTIRIRDIHIQNAQTLLHFPEFSVHVGGIDVHGGFFSFANDRIYISATLSATHGQVILLPDLFGLVDARATSTLRDYRNRRSENPWAALDTELQPRYSDEYGALVIPIRNLNAQRFLFEGDGFRIGAVAMELDGQSLNANGAMEILDEHDHDDKERSIRYDLEGDLVLSPTGALIDYFAEDLFQNAPGQSATGHLGFDIEGDLVAIGGSLTVEFRNVGLADVPVDLIAIEAETEPGKPFEVATEGLRAEVGDAVLLGEGWFDPADGTYDFRLWLHSLDLRDLIPSDSPIGPIGVVSTVPSHPGPEEAPIRLTGDLDARRLGDFAAARLADPAGEPLPDMVVADLQSLRFTPDPMAGLPVTDLNLFSRIRLAADGRVHLQGQQGTPNFTLTINQAHRVAGYGTFDLLLERLENVRVTGDADSIGDLLETDAFDAAAAVTIVLDGPVAAPNLRVTRLSLDNIEVGALVASTLVTSFNMPLGHERLTLERGELDVTEFGVADLLIQHVTGSYELDGDWLRLRDFTIDTGFGDLFVSGSVRLFNGGTNFLSSPAFDLRVQSDEVELAGLVPGSGVAGFLTVDLNVSGDIDDPRISGEVALSDGLVMDEWIDEMTATVDVRTTRSGFEVTIETFDVWADEAHIEGGLVILIGDELSIDSAHISITDLHLQDLSSLSDVPIEGVAEITLELTSPDEVTRPEWLLRGPDVQDVDGCAEWPLAELAVRPNPGVPDLAGSVIIHDFHVGGLDLGAVALAIDTYGESVVAVGQIARDFRARLVVPFDLSQEIQLSTRFDQIPLSDILPDADIVGRFDGGVACVRVNLDGDFNLVADMSIDQISVEAGDYFFSNHEDRPVHLTYAIRPDDEEGGELEHNLLVDAFGFGTDGEFLEIEGMIQDWSDLNFSIHGPLPVSLASVFTDVVADATGSVDVLMTLSGTLDEPEPNGSLTFHEATITPRGLGDQVQIHSGAVRISPSGLSEDGEPTQTIEIDYESPILGSVFGGRIEASGYINLENFQPTDLSLTVLGNNLSYSIADTMTVTIGETDLSLYSPDLTNPELFFLSGNVFVQEALYYAALGGNSGITGTLLGLVDQQTERYSQPFYEEVELLQYMQFDVRMFAHDNVVVRTRVAGAETDIELQVDDFQLTGTLPAPVTAGEVRVVEGDIVFNSQRYDVTSCSLVFLGGDPETALNPLFSDCIAETRFNRTSAEVDSTTTEGFEAGTDRLEPYIIQVSIEGRWPEVEFVFTSVNASLPRRDILSLIAFGYTVDELSTGDGTQPQINILLSELAGLLENEFEDRFSIDQVVVVPSATGAGTVIRLTDEVSDRLTWTADATVSGDGDTAQQLRAELTLFDWLQLELSERSDADEFQISGGLRFRLIER